MQDKNIKKTEWEEKILKKSLSLVPEQKSVFTTSGGIEVERVALPEELNESYFVKLGLPGEFPYTRGVQPTMYRAQNWTMRQYAGFSTASESNKRYRYLLDQGTTGLSVAFDLPTQIGLDSDDPICQGEVGKVGVAIDSLADMEILFDKIPLNKISTSMTINSPASVLLAMYKVVGEKQGVASRDLKGTIQNDILKEYIARGTYIFPPHPSLRIVTDIFKWCGENMPMFNTISISGYHIREAGSTAVQEVAFTLANGCAYVQAAIDSGLDVDAFGKRLAFFFNAATDLFEEIAKFRAARRLWAKIMKNRFNSKNPGSQMLRFHTQTAGHTLTAQQPDNNIVRVTLQALAAVLGGTQSLHTNSRDEALSLPTEDSVKIALRTQQIIANEAFITNTVDPLAGSYHVEMLTDRIEKEAEALIKQIDERGGVIKSIEDGFIQRQIENSSYKYQQQIENGERIIVGVNKYESIEENKTPILKIDQKNEEDQIKKLKELKKNRNNEAVNRALSELKSAAIDKNCNLMPPIVAAVRDYASLGEICGVLRSVFGEFRDRG